MEFGRCFAKVSFLALTFQLFSADLVFSQDYQDLSGEYRIWADSVYSDVILSVTPGGDVYFRPLKKSAFNFSLHVGQLSEEGFAPRLINFSRIPDPTLQAWLKRNPQNASAVLQFTSRGGREIRVLPSRGASDDLVFFKIGTREKIGEERWPLPEDPNFDALSKNIALPGYHGQSPELLFNQPIGRLGLRGLHRQGLTGRGVGVLVVDSGIDPRTFAARNLVEYRTFRADLSEAERGRPSDYLSHGSWVSAMVQQSAPDANLIVAQVPEASGPVPLTQVLKWARENAKRLNLRVINFSMGLRDNQVGDWNDCDEFHQEVQKAVLQGIHVVAASGNRESPQEGIFISKAPACYSETFSIGSLDQKFSTLNSDDVGADESVAGFSIAVETSKKSFLFWSSTERKAVGLISRPCLYAPGCHVLVPMATGTYSERAHDIVELENRRMTIQEYLNKHPESAKKIPENPSEGYLALLRAFLIENSVRQFTPNLAMVSGTSFAAPLVAGGIACLRQEYPDLEVADLEKAIVDSAADPHVSLGDGFLIFGTPYGNYALAHTREDPALPFRGVFDGMRARRYLEKALEEGTLRNAPNGR